MNGAGRQAERGKARRDARRHREAHRICFLDQERSSSGTEGVAPSTEVGTHPTISMRKVAEAEPKLAMPRGLILNELLTNTFNYAFRMAGAAGSS